MQDLHASPTHIWTGAFIINSTTSSISVEIPLLKGMCHWGNGYGSIQNTYTNYDNL